VLITNPIGANIFELPKLSFISILLAIILLVLVIKSFKKGELFIRYNKIVYIFFGLWMLSLVLSTVFSVAPQLSFWGTYSRLQGLYSHLIYLSYFLLFLHFLTEEKAQKFFLKFLIGIGILASIHAILQQFGIWIFSENAIEEFLNRSFGTLGHPNFLGQFLLFPIWAAIYLFTKENKKHLYIPILILLFEGLILTQNRASILGLSISFIAFILIKLNIKNTYKYLLCTAVILGFASFIFFIYPSLRSVNTRLILWENSVKLIPDHPVIGSGLETFESVFQKVADSKLFNFERVDTLADRSHNQYLDVFVVQGGFGLIIYLAIIGTILYLIIRNKENLILGLSLLSVFISDFFGFSLVIEWLLIIGIIAIILNNSVSFKGIKIKTNLPITILLIGILCLSPLLIIRSVKVIQADNYYNLGTNHYYSENSDLAEKYLTKAAELNQYQSEIYFQLGEILYLKAGKTKDESSFNQAEKFIEKAGEFTGENFQYHFAKGELFVNKGDFDMAEKEYKKAKTLAPVNPKILEGIKNLYQEKTSKF